jgi:hypothetical protein
MLIIAFFCHVEQGLLLLSSVLVLCFCYQRYSPRIHEATEKGNFTHLHDFMTCLMLLLRAAPPLLAVGCRMLLASVTS